MKKIFVSLCLMLSAVASVWAEADITGLKVVMTGSSEEVVTVLFTDSPVVSHDVINGLVVISATGMENVTLRMNEIQEMSFGNVTSTTAIEKLFPRTDESAPMGIYTLSGQKVDKVEKGQVYSINGNKVLVK